MQHSGSGRRLRKNTVTGVPPLRPTPFMSEERLKQLIAMLQLNEAQRNQIAAVLPEARERVAALRRRDASQEEQRREIQVQRERP